jgi:excisionase family DNA binding protein
VKRPARADPLPEWVADACRDLPPLMKLEEVSITLRAHARTVRRLIAAGRLKAIRSRVAGSSRVLVARAEVARYLESLGAA